MARHMSACTTRPAPFRMEPSRPQREKSASQHRKSLRTMAGCWPMRLRNSRTPNRIHRGAQRHLRNRSRPPTPPTDRPRRTTHSRTRSRSSFRRSRAGPPGSRPPSRRRRSRCRPVCSHSSMGSRPSTTSPGRPRRDTYPQTAGPPEFREPCLPTYALTGRFPVRSSSYYQCDLSTQCDPTHAPTMRLATQ